jgi:hypothetical protein
MLICLGVFGGEIEKETVILGKPAELSANHDTDPHRSTRTRRKFRNTRFLGLIPSMGSSYNQIAGKKSSTNTYRPRTQAVVLPSIEEQL